MRTLATLPGIDATKPKRAPRNPVQPNKAGTGVLCKRVTRIPWAFATFDALKIHASKEVETAHALCVGELDKDKSNPSPHAVAPSFVRIVVSVEVVR